LRKETKRRVLQPIRNDDRPKTEFSDKRRVLKPKRRPKMVLRESFDEPKKINQTATGNNNTQISASGNVNTNPPQELNPMDLAMEEIRAAKEQREAHAKQFQQMMSGSFANAFPQNISQEMADMIAAFKLQGMSNQQATELARQQLGG